MNSLAAYASSLLALLALLGVTLGPLCGFFGIVSPILGFTAFALGLLAGVPALLLELVGLLRTRLASHRGGASQAWGGTVVGLLLLALGFVVSAPGRGVPPIHDLTTSPERPPGLEAAARHPDNAARDLTYPHGGARVTELQRSAYPDLEPIVLDVGPDEAYARARLVALGLGWQLDAEDRSRHRLEAHATSRLFRFVDDVAIEIEPAASATAASDTAASVSAASGSVVHVRSTSRVGQSDLGANAARIRQFRDRLLQSGA